MTKKHSYLKRFLRLLLSESERLGFDTPKNFSECILRKVLVSELRLESFQRHAVLWSNTRVVKTRIQHQNRIRRDQSAICISLTPVWVLFVVSVHK